MTARSTICAVATTLFCTIGLAQPAGPLSKAEVEATIVGKTFTLPFNTAMATWLVQADGVLYTSSTGDPRFASGQARSSGKWKLDETGKFCFERPKSQAADGCRLFVRRDDGLYIVNAANPDNKGAKIERSSESAGHELADQPMEVMHAAFGGR